MSQGLASGALRGEEFNSINEGGARITKALADSLGLTVGRLRAVAAEGKLTNDVVVKGLLSQAPVLAAEFGKVPRTVGDATTQIGNSMLRAVASVNKAADATSSLVGQLDRVRALIDDPAFAGIMSGIAASIVADIRTVNDIFREVEAVRAWAAEIQASAATAREAIAASASSLYTTWKTATDQNMALIGPWIEAWTLGALSVQDANSAAASNAGLSWSGFVDASVNEIATLIAAAKALGGIGSELGIAGTFQAELASAREMLNGYRDTLTGAGSVVLDTVIVPAQEATGAMLAMKYGVREVTAATVAAVPPTIKLGESTDALEKAAKKATESFANQDRAIDSQVAGLQRQIDAFDASEGSSAALHFRAVPFADAAAQASQEAAQ